MINVGPKQIDVDSNTILLFQVSELAYLSHTNSEGEIINFHLKPGRVNRIKVIENCSFDLKIPELAHWDVTHHQYHEKPDPVPFELIEENQRVESLSEKVARMVGEIVSERYGADSQEFDTLEESMDLDIDEDGWIGSKYEIPEFVEEVPNLPSEEKPADPPAGGEAPQNAPTAPDNIV